MNVLLNFYLFTQNVCHDFAECWTLALSKQDLDQKCMHFLMEINVGIFEGKLMQFLVKILYWQCKNPALYNVSSSTSQRLSVNLRSGLVCESDSSSSFQPFFHNALSCTISFMHYFKGTTYSLDLSSNMLHGEKAA